MSKNIVFVDQYCFLGGGQQVLIEMVSSALNEGMKVCVLIPLGGDLESAIHQRFGNAVSLKNIKIKNVSHGKKTFLDIIRLINDNFFIFLMHFTTFRGSAVYINGGRLFFLGALLAVYNISSVFFHLHIMPKKTVKKILTTLFILPTVKAVIANSKFIADGFSDGKIWHPKLHLIENELPAFFSILPFKRINFRNGLIVVTPGTIRPEKGQHLVFYLARKFTSIQFHLVGRVGEGAEIWFQNLLSEKPENLTINQQVNDLSIFFDAIQANVCLVPSCWEEPFGLVAIEGMACSCIAVLASRGGLIEIAENTNALTFCSLSQLEKVFNTLSSCNVARLEELSRDQYKRVMSRYGQRIFGSKIINLILEHGYPKQSSHCSNNGFTHTGN